MLAGFDETMAYMASTFGFSERETVAIMGAHSLGQAKCASTTASYIFKLLASSRVSVLLTHFWVGNVIVDGEPASLFMASARAGRCRCRSVWQQQHLACS